MTSRGDDEPRHLAADPASEAHLVGFVQQFGLARTQYCEIHSAVRDHRSTLFIAAELGD